MSPGQLLQQIRSHYCTRLKQAIDDFVSDGIVTMAAEAVLRKPDGSLATRGSPPTPARVDVITLINGEVRDGLTIESDTMPTFPPFSLQWEHVLPVRVGPFPWNACDVRATLGNQSPNWKPLDGWFTKFFDPEESRRPGEDGLLGVVHTISTLPADAGSFAWQVDFGSAEVEAFEELLDALKQMGVVSVEVGKLAPADAPTMPHS